MIEKINFIRYRKLKNISLEFDNGVNVISGTNGTCKTSLLHLISNSFQSVTGKCQWLNDKNSLYVMNRINNSVNPKLETLVKGDKKYNNPAPSIKGTLYTVKYTNGVKLNFRQHISKNSNRYAVKPQYKKGTKDKLPICPIIYLSLSRLFPYGEYQNEPELKKINIQLPTNYQTELSDLYKNFTQLDIMSCVPQKMGDIKKRSEFSSNTEGIDSNTISAGEDNLYIILTSIISLKYYYESITSNNIIESVLLIDELDATLHPSYQTKLFDLFSEYSKKYKIQVFFTTHSLSLIEYAFTKKKYVTYLIDNNTSVAVMDTPDFYKIKMHLFSLTRSEIYCNKKIPLFTEDDEARIFLKIIFDWFSEKYRSSFGLIRDFFHIVKAKISASNLVNLFDDPYLLESTMRSICILDGDQKNNLNNYTIKLPGNKSPETLIMDYSLLISQIDDAFWSNAYIHSLGYSKSYFSNNIQPDIQGIEKKINQQKQDGKSTKGMRRTLNKEVFNNHRPFFELMFKHWVNNSDNKTQLDTFYENLHKLFLKTSYFHSINPNEWVK